MFFHPKIGIVPFAIALAILIVVILQLYFSAIPLKHNNKGSILVKKSLLLYCSVKVSYYKTKYEKNLILCLSQYDNNPLSCSI